MWTPMEIIAAIGVTVFALRLLLDVWTSRYSLGLVKLPSVPTYSRPWWDITLEKLCWVYIGLFIGLVLKKLAEKYDWR